MLQQTRAQAAVPYYERFLERFPSVQTLAAASEEEVLALWSGLGYYSRARNLRRAAQHVAEADGFPREYQAIRALPGVGDYTAAAIASIAFGLPRAVVDGNVMRVVARLQADSGDIASVRTRERFRSIAQAWLDRKQPGAFNQAFMELGATVCLPKNPLCPVCPLSTCCLARQQGIAAQLPVKLRKTDPVKIAAVLLLVRKGGRLLLRRTEAGARQMAGFWELPSPEQLPGARIGKTLGEFRHTITHHHYTFTVKTASGRPAGAEFGWFTAAQLADIPLSTMARKALRLARNP
jgi:A/G-specific adenine glycosylase